MKSWDDWRSEIARGVAGVPDEEIERAAMLVRHTDLVLCAGNGGSAAIASHAAQAFAKPSYKAGGGRGAVCLTDNVPLLTAHANDGGWEDALTEIARPYLAFVRLPALLAVSSSGRSENIVQLARLFAERKLPIVALTGFQGEPLRSLATVSLHVDSDDYEVVEPVHQAVLHRLQARLRG